MAEGPAAKLKILVILFFLEDSLVFCFEFGFFRVHRRYIVNLVNVEDVETVPSGAIQLGVSGVDERIPVSRRRVVPLKKALNL